MPTKHMSIDEAFAAYDLNSQVYLPWRTRWEESSAAYDPNKLVIMDERQTRERAMWLGFETVEVDQILNFRGEFVEKSGLLPLLWHLFYCFSQMKDPLPTNYATSPKLPESLGHHGELFYLYLYLCLVEYPMALDQERGVPEEITQATLHDVVRWTRFNSKDKGRLALTQSVWLNHHMNSRLHQIGRLQFERRACDYKSIIARDSETGELRGYGEDEHDQVWGKVILEEGDPIVSIHIPRSGAMDHDVCTKSFVDAKQFFTKYYPEFQPKAYCCFSWLTNPLWSQYLMETSNVRKFVERYHPYPLEAREDTGLWYWLYQKWEPFENLDDAPQESSVQRAFVKHLKDGKKWFVSGGYILPEEIDAYDVND
ncbi:acyltransferase domain-containing protein [Poriferisphaera sp. WC338]|uniref:acyltransferase domain-containing protein n=1 Tax=Poriferisphaera sp. WC338 TaxID=3425129 RepID=UPI003D81C3DF